MLNNISYSPPPKIYFSGSSKIFTESAWFLPLNIIGHIAPCVTPSAQVIIWIKWGQNISNASWWHAAMLFRNPASQSCKSLAQEGSFYIQDIFGQVFVQWEEVKTHPFNLNYVCGLKPRWGLFCPFPPHVSNVSPDASKQPLENPSTPQCNRSCRNLIKTEKFTMKATLLMKCCISSIIYGKTHSTERCSHRKNL